MYNIHVEFLVKYFEYDSINKHTLRAKRIDYLENIDNKNNPLMKITTIDNETVIILSKDFISASVNVRTEPD